MNKSSVKHKRSLGKNSPLSKRPKLDFTITTRSSLRENDDTRKESSIGCKIGLNEKSTEDSAEKKKDENLSASDWDDDFSGDMLEKVCLIADLSQAMANSQLTPELEKQTIDFSKKKHSPKSRSVPAVESFGSYEKLKLEFEKLQEKFKTKEGEVHILRSQLKQYEDTKQAAILKNKKAIEEIQEKYNDKLNLTEKELENIKSKLLFKDLEYKTLSERCRQLEYSITKNKLAETQNTFKPFNPLSHFGVQTKETCVDRFLNSNDNSVKDPCIRFVYFTPVQHEGKNLAKILCPEFFKYVPEPSVVPFYFSCSKIVGFRNSIDKVEKYVWNDLPKPTAYIKNLYKDVSSLFTFVNFNKREVIETIQAILNACEEILSHQNDVFKFLKKLHLRNIEFDKADQYLLQREEKTEILTIKNILNCKKLHEEECGIELRRSLGLIHSLMEVSKTAFEMVKANMMFMKYFRDIVASIGKLRRPLRYTGVLAGICFILQKLLEDKSLGKEFLTLISETVKELIFARPQLDVLREVVNVLATGKCHLNFLAKLCRRESFDSCTLYMDCRLKQTMFFTKNACPVKILCMQIMALAGLRCNRDIKWDITECVIKWLNSSFGTQNSKKLKWLPAYPTFMEEERCFNVTECLLFLLVLCLNEYNHNFPSNDSFDDDTAIWKTETEKKKKYLISVISQGAVLFKRILKADQRHLHDNCYCLRFSQSLKDFIPFTSNLCRSRLVYLTPIEMEAMCWICELVESDLRNQDCCLKQNVSALLDADVPNILKINETKMI